MDAPRDVPRTLVPDTRGVRIFTVLLVIHAVVVAAFVAGRALHTRLGPMNVAGSGGAAALAQGFPPTIPVGRSLEEYVHSGLVDLRIMLLQAARRGHG